MFRNEKSFDYTNKHIQLLLTEIEFTFANFVARLFAQKVFIEMQHIELVT